MGRTPLRRYMEIYYDPMDTTHKSDNEFDYMIWIACCNRVTMMKAERNFKAVCEELKKKSVKNLWKGYRRMYAK